MSPTAVARSIFVCHFYSFSLGLAGVGVLPALVHSLEQSFELNHTDMGTLLGGGSITLAIFSVFSGWLYDRVGARRILAIGMLLSCIAALWIALSNSFWMFAAALLAFYGTHGLAAVVNPLSAMLYKGERMRGINLLHGFQGVGRLLAPLFVWVVILLGGRWQPVFIVAAVVFLICGLLFYRMVAEPPRVPAGSGPPSPGFFRMLGTGIAPGLIGFMFVAGCELGIITWVPAYIEVEAGYSKQVALYALAAMMLGYTIVRMSLGLTQRRPGSRFITSSLALTWIGLAMVLFSRGVPLVLAGNLFLGLSLGAFWPSLTALLYDATPRGHGVLNAWIIIASITGSFVFMVLTGYIGDHFGLAWSLVLCPAAGIVFCIAYHHYHRLTVTA